MTSGESLKLLQSDRLQEQDLEHNSTGQNHSSFMTRLQSALQERLIATITVSILFSLALTGGSAWHIWRMYNGLQTTIAKQFKLQDLSGEIIHLDEVLTMSARMAASTGDAKWENRYNQYVPKLDAAIGSLLKDVPITEQSNPKATKIANDKLVELETKAFELNRQGKSQIALQLLLGPEYEAQKEIYNKGTLETLQTVKKRFAAELQYDQQSLENSIAFAIASALLLAVSWIVVLLAVKGYIRDRKASQTALLNSQTNLVQTNQQLESEATQRAKQEQQIREESELLQADIAHILDVVSALEEGDLTIQAEVNERATGLVSDTLNRLIESLNSIVSVVVASAQAVSQNTIELEQLAIDTAEQAQSQTESVQDVKSLMDRVNTLTENSLQQAISTDEAIKLAKSAVIAGQQGMDEMTHDLTTLQQGAHQIVKRTELLSDFVDLASKFSKDQKRVASLTRVLALNASTLSTRALKEQNPAQFASIAKEFETIARQVNDLASDTNQSLVLLQQRTTQIQTVTSGLNQDISEIGQLIQTFTSSVTQSRQAFDHIQTITEQVAQVGQKVSESSQTIVTAVQNTLTETGEIEAVAQQTETKAHTIRIQVEEMDNLARTLLQRVEFFHLQNATSETSHSTESHVDPSLSHIPQIMQETLQAV